MIKKIVAFNIIVLFVIISFLPIINGSEETNDSLFEKSLNGKNDDIIFKEYYPGAPFVSNICYYKPNELIVRFKDTVNINDLEEVDDHPIVKYNYNNNAVLIRAEDADLKLLLDQLNNKNDVLYAEYNGIVFACNSMKGSSNEPDDQLWDNQWGHQMIYCQKAWEQTTGKDIKVAVLDTGIDDDHEDFNCPGKIPFQWNIINNSGCAEDDSYNSHGTFVSGIIGACYNNNHGIAGVAPDCKIVPIKILDGNTNDPPVGELWVVDNGIHWAHYTAKADIISMSFVINGDFPGLKSECDDAYNDGIVLVAAAGNHYCNKILYPADYPSVIAVGAIDQNKERCDFSNYGENLTFVAPGIDIVSTIRTELGKYAEQDGKTSAATAYVAGIFALLKEKYTDDSPDELKERLIEIAEDLGEPEKDIYYGHGLAMAYKYYAPTVKITYPNDNSQVKSGTIKIKGNAYDQNDEDLEIHAHIIWWIDCVTYGEYDDKVNVVDNKWELPIDTPPKSTHYLIYVKSFDGELYSKEDSISLRATKDKNIEGSYFLTEGQSQSLIMQTINNILNCNLS